MLYKRNLCGQKNECLLRCLQACYSPSKLCYYVLGFFKKETDNSWGELWGAWFSDMDYCDYWGLSWGLCSVPPRPPIIPPWGHLISMVVQEDSPCEPILIIPSLFIKGLFLLHLRDLLLSKTRCNQNINSKGKQVREMINGCNNKALTSMFIHTSIGFLDTVTTSKAFTAYCIHLVQFRLEAIRIFQSSSWFGDQFWKDNVL